LKEDFQYLRHLKNYAQPPLPIMSSPFARKPVKLMLDPEDLAWAPHNMTPSQALDQLPLVCQLQMTSPPNQKTLDRLRYYHAGNVADNNPEIALLIARCIVRAEQIMEEKGGGDGNVVVAAAE